MSTIVNSAPVPTTARVHASYQPQTSPDTDLVLASCNGTSFHVHAAVMALASPFFKSMVSLRRDPSESPSDPIRMSEHEQVLATLLDHIYPSVTPSTIPSIRLLEAVGVAADKYEMHNVTARLQTMILAGTYHKNRIVKTVKYPVIPLYAVSTRLGWDGIGFYSAKLMLKKSLNAHLREMNDADLALVESSTLVKIERWHDARLSRVKTALDEIRGYKSYFGRRTFSWKDLHVEYERDGPINDRCESIMAADMYEDEPDASYYGLGDAWELALLRFKNRVMQAMKDTPNGSRVLDGAFYANWEFKDLQCKYCHCRMVDEQAIQRSLRRLVKSLPRYPGDEDRQTDIFDEVQAGVVNASDSDSDSD